MIQHKGAKIEYRDLKAYYNKKKTSGKVNVNTTGVCNAMGYIEISLNSLELAIKNPNVETAEMQKQIAGFAKEQLQYFVNQNIYIDCYNSNVSFSLFNDKVYFDANRFWQFSKDGSYADFIKAEIGTIQSDYISGQIKYKNDILGGRYRPNYDLHIIYKDNPNDFFKFLIDAELHESLYVCFKNETKKKVGKKTIVDCNQLTVDKLNQFNDRLDVCHKLLLSNPASTTVTEWYELLNAFVGRLMLHISNIPISIDVKTRKIIYLFQKIFETNFNIESSSDSFHKFIQNIMGIDDDTCKRYLRHKMGLDDDVDFTNKWFDILTNLDVFHIGNDEFNKFVVAVLNEKHRVMNIGVKVGKSKKGKEIKDAIVMNDLLVNMTKKYKSN